MATKEQKRKKEDKSENKGAEHQSPVASITRPSTQEMEEQPDLTELETELSIQTDTDKTQITTEAVIPLPVEQVLYPTWGSREEAGYMYDIPAIAEQRELWANEWADFILEWMSSESLHILNLSDFIRKTPFKEFYDKTTTFWILGDTLVNKRIAEWLDKEHTSLRVYWRTLEEWADILYKWALSVGSILLDLQSLIIQESKQEFATLPPNDLRKVLTIMVSKGLAEWVDTKRYAIRIKI